MYHDGDYKDLFISLWKPHRKGLVMRESDNSPPILALYLTFRDRMCKILSLDPDSTMFLGHCLYPKIDPYASNQVAIPRFEINVIDNVFVYSDLV